MTRAGALRTQHSALSKRLKEAGRWLGLESVSALVSAAAFVTHQSSHITGAEAYCPDRVERILAIRLDPLGDLLLTRPALAALRHRFPEARMDLLALPYTAPIGRLFPEIDDCLAYDVHQLRPSGHLLRRQNYVDLVALIRDLRARRYDLAISFCGRVASFFAWASGARWRFGLAGEAAAYTLTNPLPGRRYDRRHHEAAYCLDLAAAAGATDRPPFRPVSVPPDLAEQWLARVPEWTAPGRPKVVLHPGASNGWAKKWTPEGFAGLARHLVERSEAVVAVTGSAGEASLTQFVAGAGGSAVLDLAGRLDLRGLATVIAGADLVVSGDSGPLHLATQLGRPVVGIYGPSDPGLSGPFEGKAEVVRLDLPCSPCYDATRPAICPLDHHRCMKELPVAVVAAAAERRLSSEVLSPEC